MKSLTCCRQVEFSANIDQSTFNESASSWSDHKAAFFDNSNGSIIFTAGTSASHKNEIYYIRDDLNYALFYSAFKNQCPAIKFCHFWKNFE